MFGHQNNDDDSTQNSTNPALPGSFPALPTVGDNANDPFNPALPTNDSKWSDNQATPAVTATESAPAFSAPVSGDDAVAATPAGDAASTDALLDIKQKALSQLSPLVSQLDQTPEEKFRTTMMMIQATDNQDLVKDAYAAAQEISDEKSKAQALLDIVNEINYFTQHPQG